MHPFQTRPINFLRIHPHEGWQIKLYSIRFGSEPINESDFEPALTLALRELPRPAMTPSRPGVGFCILHRGRGANYVVLAWWDRDNELPLRVFVQQDSERHWRPAQGNESICVWDLQVIGFERNAYVTSILATPAQSSDEYLRRVLD